MRNPVLKGALVLAFSLLLPAAVSATPITWTLNNVVFLDGVATASGSFVYDATTNTVSSVAITTTAGPGFLCSNPPTCSTFSVVPGAFAGASYDLGFSATPAGDLIVTLQSLALPDLTGSTIFQMLFVSPLTNGGGTVGLVAGAWGEYICLAPACDTFSLSTTTLRTMTGEVTAAPEPGTFALLAGGIGLAWLGRRRLAARTRA